MTERTTVEIDHQRIVEIIRYVLQRERSKTSAVAKLYKLLPYQRDFVRRLVGAAHETEELLSILDECGDVFPTKSFSYWNGHETGVNFENRRLAGAVTTFLQSLESRP